MKIEYKKNGDDKLVDFTIQEIRDYVMELLTIMRKQWQQDTEIQLCIRKDESDSDSAWFESHHPHYLPKITINLYYYETPNDIVPALCHEFAHYLTREFRQLSENVFSLLSDKEVDIVRRLSSQTMEVVAMRLEGNIQDRLTNEMNARHVSQGWRGIG